jgi:hypothetical protein
LSELFLTPDAGESHRAPADHDAADRLGALGYAIRRPRVPSRHSTKMFAAGGNQRQLAGNARLVRTSA